MNTCTPCRVTLLVVLLSACGAGASQGELLPKLRSAINAPVSSPEAGAENSRVVEEVADEDALYGMTRDEVAAAIGKGEPCSRHPKCGEQDFQEDDWYYVVGTHAEGHVGQLPILIVGFDRFGKVDRTWNLRTH